MKALLDTDVIVDYLIDREPWGADALTLWTAHEQGVYEACITATTPGTVFYIIRKQVGIAYARELMRELVTAMAVCAVDTAVLAAAGHCLSRTTRTRYSTRRPRRRAWR